MNDTRRVPILPFFLAALCQISGHLFEEGNIYFSAREGILGAALSAVMVWLLLCGLAALDIRRIKGVYGWLKYIWGAALIVGLAAAVLDTLFAMAKLCRSQFPGMEGWLLLFIPALLLMRPALAALGRAAHVVVWLCVICGVILILGLAGQARWYVLSPSPPQLSGVSTAAGLLLCFAPEYLALPLVSDARRGTRLPFGIFAIESAAALLGELIFGYSAKGGRSPASEVLRAWSFGAFSRMDALLAGLWLLLALFRLLWIEALVLHLAQSVLPQRKDTVT